MAQRHIEILIGRLVTDEAFRTRFIGDPDTTLRDLAEAGYELTGVEIAALLTIDCTLWAQIADRIDPRLLKAALVP